MFLFYFLLIISVQNAACQDPLLKIGDNSQCIKQVIDTFIKKQTCQKLSENQKTTLAIKMTNCLNIKLGKELVPECNDLKKCRIQGDDWQIIYLKRNSFTTFFTHIDNLCHFYWDLLYHERTETLIDNLSGSAILTQDILKRNYESTQKILSTQEIVTTYMQQSLTQNIKLSESLKSSQSRVLNMTHHIENFMRQLNQNLVTQYSSIVKVMQTINEGIDGLNTVQGIMMSDINTMSGILYFLLQLLIIAIFTSFKFFRKNRIYSFSLFATNVILQLLLPDFILLMIGLKLLRIIFVLIHVINLTKSFFAKDNHFQQMKNYMDGRLDTRRIKRIFKQIIEEGKMIDNQRPN